MPETLNNIVRYWSGKYDFERWRDVNRSPDERRCAFYNMAGKIALTGGEIVTMILGVLPDVIDRNYVMALRNTAAVLVAFEAGRFLMNAYFRSVENWYSRRNVTGTHN